MNTRFTNLFVAANPIRQTLMLLVLVCLATPLFSQEVLDETRPDNGISLNLLGDGSLISINYEHHLISEPNFLLAGKVGLGYNEEFKFCFGTCSPAESYLTLPHHITANIGKGRHFLELGLGGTFVLGETSQPYLIYPIIGYRLSPLRSNKTTFRIFGQWPISGIETDDIIFIPLGISVGISL